MKLLQIYNQYRSRFGGEETVVDRISNLVKKNGGEARLLTRSSRSLEGSLFRQTKAFFSGIYNPFAVRWVMENVSDFQPDVVHVHNLYPLISPSVILALRRAGIPVVMTVHNHLHTCPTLDHLLDGVICERCVGGREYHCVIQNCRGNLVESTGYALRSTVARRFRLFTDNVTIVVALNQFAKNRLIEAGFSSDRVIVLPNMVEFTDLPADASHGEYAVYSGRMSPEKGVATLLEAAGRIPDIPIHLLGDGPDYDDLRAHAPPNAKFMGQLSRDRVLEAYRKSRFLVFPSRCFEGCPLVISEAMSHGLPVVASRISGIPELVDEGVTGLLFKPGNADELASKMTMLWKDPDLCARMGQAGRKKAHIEYSEEVHWSRLLEIYNLARERVNPGSPLLMT